MSYEAFETYRTRFHELVDLERLIPAWTLDGAALAFVDGPADDRTAWRVDLATGEKTVLVDVEKARVAIAAATGETPPGQGLPFQFFAFAGPSMIAFQIGADSLTLDLESMTAFKAPAPGAIDTLMELGEQVRMTPKQFKRINPLVDPLPAFEVLSPDAKFFLSTQDANIVVRSTYDGRTVQLTNDGTTEVDWRFDLTDPSLAALGLAVPVTNWSPDGMKIAAYKVDNRGVAHVPQVHYLKRDDQVVHRYAAKAGGVLERYALHVLNLFGQPSVELDLGDTTDTYPVHAAWLPDSSALIVFSMSRDCRTLRVLRADATDGTTTELFSEEGETFRRIHHDIYYGRKLGLTLTTDGIVWLSERSGWNHLYLYGLDGTLVRQLTSGDWPVHEVKAVHDGFVYFTGSRNQSRPYDVHLYRVPIDGGEVVQLTEADGVHSVSLAPSGTAFVDTYSRPDAPQVHELRGVDGSLRGEIARASIDRLEAVGYTPPEQFTVLAADGSTELWGVMFKPHDFDPAKRYPVIEYIYGGAQVAVAPHAFGTAGAFGTYARALAQLGYITVVLDARGTPGRSKAFHDESYSRWANCMADDHAGAILQLARRYPFIDASRVGITGGSWGGYSSFRCLADRPDVYKAAACSAPGFDPFSSVLYECYLGLPQDNLDGYRFADPMPLAANVQGEVMLIGGTSDHATWTDAVKMSEALIRAGKQHEFVPLPEQYHGYDTMHDAYQWRKVASFFERTL